MSTKIPTNGGGWVALDDDGFLTWHLNREDGLGQDLWPRAIPKALITALGPDGTVALIEALHAAGRGFAIDQPKDLDQQRERWQAADDAFTRGARGGV